MSWAKRNLYFLVSGILAVGLLVAAGWYCYSSSASNSANWEQLSQAYTQLQQLATKNPGAGNEQVDNITAARDQTKEVRARVAEMKKFFSPIPGIPNTNHFDDRIMASAVRGAVSQLRASAAAHNVTVPPDFAFSFSLQVGKVLYDPASWDQLSKQLGEIRTICDTLYNCRISALDSVQREHTSDDISMNQPATQPDYVDAVGSTNNLTIITPYQVTFECFTPELGSVLSSFANQSHTIIVKTLNVQPVETGYTPEAMQQPGMMPINARNGLPVVIDEKKLRVIMLLDVVKTLPGASK